MWQTSKRYRAIVEGGQIPYIIHIGDHDPSGIDMSRDIAKRLGVFLFESLDFPVQRVALNMDQIEEHKPPPNYVKVTDSRSPAYVEEFGDDCWELDALAPPVLRAIIEEAVEGVMDRQCLDNALVRESNRAEIIKYYAKKETDMKKQTHAELPEDIGKEYPNPEEVDYVEIVNDAVVRVYTVAPEPQYHLWKKKKGNWENTQRTPLDLKGAGDPKAVDKEEDWE